MEGQRGLLVADRSTRRLRVDGPTPSASSVTRAGRLRDLLQFGASNLFALRHALAILGGRERNALRFVDKGRDSARGATGV